MLASIASKQQQVRELQARLEVLDEADKALGRSGIPSFVLEGMLGELQAR